MKYLRWLLPGLLAGCALPGFGGTAELAIGPGSSNVNVGDSFNVAVVLVPAFDIFTGFQPVAGFQFDFLFPAFLEATNVTEAGYFSFAGCCFSYTSIDNTNGVISGVSDVAFPGQNSPDLIAQITLKALTSGSGSFSLLNSALSDENGNAIDLTVSGANVSAVYPNVGGPGNGPPGVPEPGSAFLLAPGLGYLLFRRFTAARGH